MTNHETERHETPNGGAATEPKNAKAKGAPRIPWSELARRAQDGLSRFPSNLTDRIKKYPYATIGVAVGVGVGVGMVLGSRILRMVFASAVSYVAVEVARAYLRERVMRPDGASVVRT
jgi:hypothetical protein